MADFPASTKPILLLSPCTVFPPFLTIAPAVVAENMRKSVACVIEVTEIDRDNNDMYQVLGQVEATDYSVDTVRIKKEGEKMEGKEKMLVGKVLSLVILCKF